MFLKFENIYGEIIHFQYVGRLKIFLNQFYSIYHLIIKVFYMLRIYSATRVCRETASQMMMYMPALFDWYI